jgi:predicted TIM-barrel fold metal-dependent hydrolase
MTQSSNRRFRLFDAHFHIIDNRFPLVENQGFLPVEFGLPEYQEIAHRLGIAGGVIVSGSYHAFDQSFLLDALEKLGPTFAGVTQLQASVSDEELLALNEAGVRGVRFNVKRHGLEVLSDLESMAKRIYDLVKWHAEIYIESRHLEGLLGTLIRLPKVSIDHLGLTEEGFPHLLKLAERGAQIKATGFGRVELDVRRALREISKANPGSLVFGTDLPGTRARRAFEESDVELVAEALGEEMARRVCFDNAVAFYAPRRGDG